MIELRDVSFVFQDGTEALRNISAVFPEGMVTAVLGPNGSGKTTLFKCMLGLYPKCGGRILQDGEDLRTMPPAKRAEKIAYIPQHGGRESRLILRDFVMLGSVRTLSLTGLPGQPQRNAADEAISRLGLENLADRPVCRLSGGERQMALIARALCQQSTALLMDEPDASLDPAHVKRVLSAAAMLGEQGHTVILSTHRPEYAARYAARILLLKNGCAAACGSASDVLTDSVLSSAYDVPMRVTSVDGELFIR